MKKKKKQPFFPIKQNAERKETNQATPRDGCTSNVFSSSLNQRAKSSRVEAYGLHLLPRHKNGGKKLKERELGEICFRFSASSVRKQFKMLPIKATSHHAFSLPND